MSKSLYEKHGFHIFRIQHPEPTGLWYTIQIGKEYVELSEEEFTDMLVTLIGGEVTHC